MGVEFRKVQKFGDDICKSRKWRISRNGNGAAFCSKCGAAQPRATYPTYKDAPNPQLETPKRGKRTAVWFVASLVALVGRRSAILLAPNASLRANGFPGLTEEQARSSAENQVTSEEEGIAPHIGELATAYELTPHDASVLLSRAAEDFVARKYDCQAGTAMTAN